MSVAPAPLPLLLAEIEAVSVERISPSFVRVVFGAEALADFGVDGPIFDQRLKLVFPYADALPSIEGADESWLGTWMERPLEERGHMRTYTVRAVEGDGVETRLVIDFVVHEDGHAGPGATWALQARPGDRLLTVAPRRGMPFGGIEWVPGEASSLVWVADESAVPAVAGILACLPDDAIGTAFLEVPQAEDFQHLHAPAGVTVNWHARGDAPVGDQLVPVVRRHFGLPPEGVRADIEVDPDLWETPGWSSSGESPDDQVVIGHDHDDLFAWIAGESAMVTNLRRALVKEVGVDRRQVAFMGYWRRGVAMKS